ncbi:hypothetical protein ABT263_23190 [Kitasatospora sp. NPDC001603]|uniref:hypothetical protein n=1 Tax=Kitasatospora sp. NPDC001603 TaxID=3154388 RepID=UPI0033336441
MSGRIMGDRAQSRPPGPLRLHPSAERLTLARGKVVQSAKPSEASHHSRVLA